MDGPSDPFPRGPTVGWPRSGSLRWPCGVLGALVGILVHPVVLALSYRTEHDPTDIADWRVLQYVVFGFLVATPLSVIVGIALAWWPRFRPLGLGLIVGVAIGVHGGTVWLWTLT